MKFLKKIGWILSWPFVAIICLIHFKSCYTSGKRYLKDPTCATTDERYEKIKKFIKIFLYWKDIKVEIIGKDKIDNKVMLFVANHKSNIDPIALLKIALDQNIPFLTYVAKKELEGTKLGKIASLIDVVYIDRNNLREIVKTINSQVDLIVKDKRSVCIFPEGTRIFDNAKFGEFKPGALEAAYQTYASIQPVVIYNSSGLLDKNVSHSKNRTVYISFLNPYNAQSYINVDKVNFAKKLENQMFEEYMKIKEKVEKDGNK